MAAEPLVHLSQVLDLAESLIERVRPEQAALPTPVQVVGRRGAGRAPRQ